MSSLKSAPINTLYHKAQAISIYRGFCYSHEMTQQSSPEIFTGKIEDLLRREPSSLIEAHSINQEFLDIFGLPFDADKGEAVHSIAWPFINTAVQAVHNELPKVAHVTFLEPELNPKMINQSVQIHSPFTPRHRRATLLGVSYPIRHAPKNEHRSQEDDPARFVSFYVRPVEGERTIATVMAKRADIILSGGAIAVTFAASRQRV